MHSPILVPLVTVIFAALIFGWLFDRLKQPPIVGYILAGVFLGPQLLGLVHDEQAFVLLGQLGLMFLLFFIGSEVRIGKLLASWRISFGGTLLHIIINVGICYGLGYLLEWSLNQVVFIGFVTSLSSTAVVLRILEDGDALKSGVGRNCVGILLVQDFMVVPMIIILSMLGDESSTPDTLGRQMVGFLGIGGLILFLIRKKQYRLPIRSEEHTSELQSRL